VERFKLWGHRRRERSNQCGDRMKGALITAFLQHAKEMNFEFVAVSDIWNRRREEGTAYIEKLGGGKVDSVPQQR
jgi:hypothetical protein